MDTNVLLQQALDGVNVAMTAYADCEDPVMPGVLQQDLVLVGLLVLARKRLHASIELRSQGLAQQQPSPDRPASSRPVA
jgi:hypothetical protein